MNRNLRVKVLCAVIFLFMGLGVMFTIYSFSSEDSSQSNVRSNAMSDVLKNGVKQQLTSNKQGIKLYETIKAFVSEYSPYGSDWNVNIRKLAHFSIYATLGAVCYITMSILGVSKTKRYVIAIGVCALFACTDEFHQSFTGRSASIYDVYLDTFGAFVSCSMLAFLFSMFERFKRHRKQKDIQSLEG